MVSIDTNLLKKRLETTGWIGIREIFYNNAKCKKVLTTNGFICCKKDFSQFYFMQQTSDDQHMGYNSRFICDMGRMFSYFYSFKNLPGDSIEELEYIHYANADLIRPDKKTSLIEDEKLNDFLYDKEPVLNNADPFVKGYKMDKFTAPNKRDYEVCEIVLEESKAARNVKNDRTDYLTNDGIVSPAGDSVIMKSDIPGSLDPQEKAIILSVDLNDGHYIPVNFITQFNKNQAAFKKFVAKRLGEPESNFY